MSSQPGARSGPDRRRKVGWDLSGLLGIAKGDATRINAQVRGNYKFLGAPVGSIFAVDRVMAQGGILDCGMFMQNVMLAAKARGLNTCPQTAFATFHQVIRAELRLPPEQMVIGGMSMGHADPNAVENTLQTVREPSSSFAVFHEQAPLRSAM